MGESCRQMVFPGLPLLFQECIALSAAKYGECCCIAHLKSTCIGSLRRLPKSWWTTVWKQYVLINIWPVLYSDTFLPYWYAKIVCALALSILPPYITKTGHFAPYKFVPMSHDLVPLLNILSPDRRYVLGSNQLALGYWNNDWMPNNTGGISRSWFRLSICKCIMVQQLW